MLNISKENKHFSLIQILTNGLCAIFFAYIVMYLEHIGYSESSIGILMAMTLLLNVVAQPVIGYLSENYIGIKKIIIACMGAMLLLVSAIPFVKDNYYIMFLIFVVISFTGKPLSSVLDMYVTQLSKIRSGLDFGFVRGFGSLGYATMAVVVGKVVERFGIDSIFIMNAFTIVLVMIVISKAEDVPINKSVKDQKKPSFILVMKDLLKIKDYVVVIFATLFVFIASVAHATYLPIIIIGLGGTSADFGVALFLSAASEAPVVWYYYKISSRFSAQSLLYASLAFFVLRMIAMWLLPNLNIMILLQLMQSISFGLFIPSYIRYVQSITPEESSSTAILFGMSIYVGVSGVLGSLMGGFVLENGGYSSFYLFCLVCTVIGFAIFGMNLFISYLKGKKMTS